MHHFGFVMLLILTAAVTVTQAEEPAGLPRIAARDGRFVEKDTGKTFAPRGFHYIRLRGEMHYVHTPGWYDREAAEAMLEAVSEGGFNVIRVFLGFPGIANDVGLDPEFVDNLMHFLEHAEKRGVYVIPVRTYLPESEKYQSVARGLEEDFPPGMAPVGDAVKYLSARRIEAKGLLLRDLVSAVRDRNPRLLSAVFAWELENESSVDVTHPPFSLTEGLFPAPNGQAYDLADEVALQRLYDDAVVHWANACVRAVREVDPDAMVATSVFTHNAVGRTGPGRMRSEIVADPRVPARPMALARSDLSYVDIHLYMPTLAELDKQLAGGEGVNIEFDELRRVCEERGMPLFCGEVGFIREWFDSAAEVAELAPKVIERMMERGFQGYCYWTYDTEEQEPLYHATTDGGAIFRALADMNTNGSP